VCLISGHMLCCYHARSDVTELQRMEVILQSVTIKAIIHNSCSNKVPPKFERVN